MSDPPGRADGVTVVVPCFNEAGRLACEALRDFVAPREWLRLLFVDDGSTDDTRRVLEELSKQPHGRIEVLGLDDNRGKAEAVRLGILQELEAQPACVGFLDADLATPLTELERLWEILQAEPSLEIVLGSRVRLLGHRIERNDLRHYFGRIAATLVSYLLDLAVYDTQCGAKLFRVTPAIRESFSTPFLTRWEFDVEILARWLRYQRSRGGRDLRLRLREVPLREWRDVSGSRLRLRDFLRAPYDLASLFREYRDVRGSRGL